MHAHAFGKSPPRALPRSPPGARAQCAMLPDTRIVHRSVLTVTDLLSLAAAKASSAEAAASNQSKKVEPGSSVPATSYLSATRPPNGTTGSTPGTKARRMSSSTTGVLGRGKLGLTGDSGLLKDT